MLKVTLGNAEAGKMPVGMVMSRLPETLTVTPQDTLERAIRIMLTHGLDGVPVVSGREVVGWVSKTPILKQLLE
jgi:CBS domain-containing protein